MWNLKKMSTNELLYKTELDSQMQKTNYGYPGVKSREAINWKIEIDTYTYYYTYNVCAQSLSRLLYIKCVSLVAQTCLTLCDTMGCSPRGSSVHGILQTRILERVSISSSMGFFPSQGSNPPFLVSHIGRQMDPLPLSHLRSPKVLLGNMFRKYDTVY